MLNVTMIGFGAIGRSVFARLAGHTGIRVDHVVVRAEQVADVQSQAGTATRVVDRVPADTALLLECAGHGALLAHVLPALERGIECAVLSVGALAEPGLPERLEFAARTGRTQVHLLSGAIGGIDAIAAARLGGLREVIYTGRKPPSGWKGSPAEQVVNLDALREATVIFDGTAREAARLYPKNANVAATLALAGSGLEATRVRLIADPAVSENVHEYEARGAFGDMRVIMRGKPLAENPKTSALTVLSALRFLANRAAALAI